MKTDDGYDFTLYDLAFDAAEKNDIKVFATIFPAEEDAKGVGGFKFPVSDLHQKQIANFIAALVNNFKDHSALEVWVLQNEPGVGHIPETSFSQNKFATWKEQVKDRPYNGYIRKHQYESEFLFQYTTWYLNWIGQEIRKYDSKTKFHVNNHMIFQLLPEYDFPSWEDFLDHLGASMHPSWHFGYFERDEYPLAISANCNLIRNGAGDNPFWVTELQAGNNNYSGFDPMMPTPDEIQQWMLTSVFGGTEGIIFWTLNSRSVGFEAGEWALIDYQNAPTRRLKAAAEVTKLIQDYPDLAKAKPVTSDVHILFSRPSMSYQKNSEMDASLMRRTYDARSKGGHIKSVLGYYQALLTQGITADISGLEEFDWAVEKGTVILPNMVIIPRKFYRPIKDFVNRGGTLLLSGQSGHLDEYQYNVLQDEDW
ncbi:MAG: beta-galactosidase, partial [Ekhidna sp.]|nr:beta-galactosidase [Ekhidna sp.]